MDTSRGGNLICRHFPLKLSSQASRCRTQSEAETITRLNSIELFRTSASAEMQSSTSQSPNDTPMVAAAAAGDQVYPSAYTAPDQPRPQAEPHHAAIGGHQQQKRGDLTADNLERIPEADHVAPGIRLETAGNDYEQQHETMNGDSRVQDSRASVSHSHLEEDTAMEALQIATSQNARAPSSMAMSGHSSTRAASHEDGSNSDHFHDADDDVNAEFYGKNADVVHERVGGSGATSENASKGASVGHFGPRGEAIPGVPPHLDPRQPHFRPPSPSAASVLSVAVHPPASPKAQAAAGPSGLPGAGSSNTQLTDVVDSGEETESFENGAMTPTLSEDLEDDTDDQLKLQHETYDAAPTKSAQSFGFGRMQIDSEDSMPASSSGPYQVSFSPVVTSHHRGSISSYSGRAPSIAATAGSSRAPSARGLSPPASASRAGTTEGSSIEEFESTGTGLGGDAGAETPSVGRSRRSSYSAPSSEVETAPPGADDNLANRARGGTLVPGATHSSSSLNVLSGATNAGNVLNSAGEGGHVAEDEGPSLAPSEAGSDSTRSFTYESSAGHGANLPSQLAGAPVGRVPSAMGSNERLPSGWSTAAVASSPVVLEPSSGGPGGSDSPMEYGQQSSMFQTHSSSSSTGGAFKSPLSAATTGQAVLPSLLAIKRAGRRNQDSASVSTAATAGTASPPSSLSVDGDFGDASG